MAEELIRTPAKSVTTFVDQTKENLLGVQTEMQNLKATVDTLANEMKADRETQKKAAAAAGKKLNETVAGIMQSTSGRSSRERCCRGKCYF